MQVWDRLVRLLHWTLVAAVATAWLSTLDLGMGWTHERAGYVAAALVSIRLVWGRLGRPYARFTQFVRQPAAVLAYGRQLWQRREPRYIGHNPLGGWMVLALLANIAAIVLTGWLQTTDRYWGSERLELIHTCLAWGLLVLIALHVAGVVFTSLRHRENLALAMITGRKAPPRGDDVA
ncbi:MAG: cytochrome B [Rubrivivax sp.]|nr:MAG: cytochrome B [Rubrivivax sp.]